MTDQIPDCVFFGLTATSPIADLSTAAYLAAARSAAADQRTPEGAAHLASDAATVAYLHDADTRSALDAWIVAYGHDEQTLDALADEARAEVLASAWLAYQTAWMQR